MNLKTFNVLLVEDETPKSKHIEQFLKSLQSSVIVKVVKSVNSALDALEESAPDLLILDMSLPTFDIGSRESGGRPQAFGGIEVLRHMKFAEMMCPTIVITGYEAFPTDSGNPMGLADLRNRLESEFPDFLHGVLHYNSTYDEWRIVLGKVLKNFGIDIRGR